MTKIVVDHNLPQVEAAIKTMASQVPFALATALNKVAAKGQAKVRGEMPNVFDRPTPWVLNSMRIKYATKARPEAELAFKDRNSAESSRSMIEPHVFTGKRHYKAMEARLTRMGLMPAGYNAVPGEAAKLDAFGNMSQGQISQLLNVLGTYTEAGYNKANAKTVSRLAKGNVKRNVYGFVYWVNKVGGKGNTHLQPGVYQRVQTGFGSSLKPVLMFVKQASYKKRLPFFEIVEKVVAQEFPAEFDTAFNEAIRTAKART